VTAINDVVANISAISRASGIVTVTTTTPHGLIASDQVTIAGVSDSSFDGAFAVATIPDSLHFTYALALSRHDIERWHRGPGRFARGGRASVRRDFRHAAGLSDAAVAAGIVDLDGGCRAIVTGIPSPSGLPNIVARILAFTGAAATIFTTPRASTARRNAISDNSATSFVVDFSDTALIAGLSADSLFNQVELGECAGVLGYAERLFWWGERNKTK